MARPHLTFPSTQRVLLVTGRSIHSVGRDRNEGGVPVVTVSAKGLCVTSGAPPRRRNSDIVERVSFSEFPYFARQRDET